MCIYCILYFYALFLLFWFYEWYVTDLECYLVYKNILRHHGQNCCLHRLILTKLILQWTKSDAGQQNHESIFTVVVSFISEKMHGWIVSLTWIKNWMSYFTVARLPFNSPTQYRFEIGVESDVWIQRPINKNHEWHKIEILYFIFVFRKWHCS